MGSGWQALYPFADHTHPLGPHRMHYVDEGHGPTVLLVHGNPTWSFLFRDLICALRPAHRCVAPDHMGMGLSDKPQDYPYRLSTHIDNLASLIDALGLEQVTLVVHDWGGPIGLGWAVRHPERVQRLVILNTAAFLSPRLPLRIRICRVPGLGALAVRGANAFARGGTWMTTVRPLPAAVKEGFRTPYDSWAHRVGILRFVQDIPMRPAHPTWPLIQAIDADLARLCDRPVLLQWGARDWCFDLAFYESWRSRFPEAEIDVYGDAGHYLLEDAGDRVAERVRAFLA